MWYKVKELFDTGLNTSQIHKEIGLDRATIRKYRSMSEKAFHEWVSRPRRLPKKLAVYHNFIKGQLQDQPFLSAPQIEDRLKEQFEDMPVVHSKTIYNFVKHIRISYNLPKEKEKQPRDCQKLPETPYGKQAQADFGQMLMQTDGEHKQRVYFFAIVLSRSRHKFVYYQDIPFTTATAVYAHEMAFEYFNGIPKEVIYDQDRVFLKDENLGDILMTDGFRAFCDSNPFKPIFCRKADPESKGKVENVIKYVKYNFMRGRKFKSLQLLQKEAVAWLKRTGNGKVHSTTGKVPYQEWLTEQQHLQPLTQHMMPVKPTLPEYGVRKDNCVTYKGSYYSLPSGTYKGQGTKVLLEVTGNKLCFHSLDGQVLAEHVISLEKGTLVRNQEHKRAVSVKMKETEKAVLELLDHEHAQSYLLLLKQHKPRYYHDNLKVMLKSLQNTSKQVIWQVLTISMEKNIYNGNEFAKVISKCKQDQPFPYGYDVNQLSVRTAAYGNAEMTPETSNINFYDSILN